MSGVDVVDPSRAPVRPGSAGMFAGPVWVQALAADPAAPVHVLHVTFAPGGRTAWHRHPEGQILVITSGRGVVQRRGGPPLVVRAGDVVVIAPHEEHWHGAAPDAVMQHLAVQTAATVVATEWGEHVEPVEPADPPDPA